MTEWENARQGKYEIIKSAKIAVGTSIIGKLVKLETNPKYPDRKTLLFQTEDGAEVLVYPSGTLNFDVQDGVFKEGKKYKITRLENKMTPNGAPRTQFEVLVEKGTGEMGKRGPTVNGARPAAK